MLGRNHAPSTLATMDEQKLHDLQRYGTWEPMTGGQWHLPGMGDIDKEHQRTFGPNCSFITVGRNTWCGTAN